MSFPSSQPLPNDKITPINQRFQLEHRGRRIGAILAHKVPNPGMGGTRDPELFWIDYVASDRDLRDYLAEAVVRWLNGSSRRMRQRIIGSEERATFDSVLVQQHLRSNVLFLNDPRVGESVRIAYIPYETRYPYTSSRYSLAGYVSEMGTINSIQ